MPGFPALSSAVTDQARSHRHLLQNGTLTASAPILAAAPPILPGATFVPTGGKGAPLLLEERWLAWMLQLRLPLPSACKQLVHGCQPG